MSLWNPEQTAEVQRANTEASFALANKAFESLQKVVDLNLRAVRSTVTETQEVMLMCFSGKPPQEWVTLQADAAELSVQRILSNYHDLLAIASNVQLEFASVANKQFVEQQRKLQDLTGGAAHRAAATAEPAVTALSSAIAAATHWYETTRKAAQQVIDVAQSNAEAVNSAVSSATNRAAERASRAGSK
jgi:phasin family protein